MSNDHNTFNIEIKDVYDFAYDIAQEFEKIINDFNLEEAIPLINKIIHVLELLEGSVKKIEQLERENSELKSSYLQLFSEKTANEEEKFNLTRSFEELEESWSQELVSLNSVIKKLKEENKLLQNNLAQKSAKPLELDVCSEHVIDEQEKLISRLTFNLNQKERKMETDRINIEKLNVKIEHLLKLNKALHLRNQEARNVIIVSNLKKKDCEAKLGLQEKRMLCLETRFDTLKKFIIEKNEYIDQENQHPVEERHHLSDDHIDFLLQEQLELKEKVLKLQIELTDVKEQTELYKRKLYQATESKRSNSEKSRIPQIFRLFLGVSDISSPCWFRGI